jgi:hypothetical protein
LSINSSGVVTIPACTAGNTLDASGPALGAGIIGWIDSRTKFGRVGYNLSGATFYSFHGNSGALLSSGSWGTSDGGLKSVTRNLDPSSALAAVNAIAVKEYKAISPAARSILYGEEGPETLYGWIAQEVEPIIPIAVRTSAIPDDDRLTRAALARVPVPEEGSAKAIALGKENMTMKVMNDHYMLTTLWAAVQRLSTQNDELQAEINALKGVTR